MFGMQDRVRWSALRGNLRSKQRIAVSGLEPKGGRRTSTVVLSFLEYHVSTRALANGTRSKAPYGGAEGEIRTHTGYNSQRFLRPPRLPFRHFGRHLRTPIIPTTGATVNVRLATLRFWAVLLSIHRRGRGGRGEEESSGCCVWGESWKERILDSSLRFATFGMTGLGAVAGYFCYHDEFTA